MIKLNLTTKSVEEEALKQYLEETASEILADKINNGVRIQKDGKTLINKKSIQGFMEYAAKKAQEQAAKGARWACLIHDTVFGWAVHYFEEDSIEEALYNEDGTPYKTVKINPAKKEVTAHTPKPVTVTKKQSDQLSLFDFNDNNEDNEIDTIDDIEENGDIEENDDSEITESQEPIEPIKAVEQQGVTVEEKPKISALYEKYLALKDKYPTALIAMRVGDFYELFDDAARLVGNKLELTITSRDFGLPERTPMVGFPYHVEEQYRKKIQDFATVAIAENEDNVKIYLKRQEETPNHKVNTATGEIIEERSEVVNDLIGILFGIFKNEMEVKM